MTTNAKEALAGAGDYEQTAKKQLQFAEDTSQVDKLIYVNEHTGFTYHRLYECYFNKFSQTIIIKFLKMSSSG